MSEKIPTLSKIKNDIRIIDYANSRGYSVIKEGRDIYSLKEHDSCKIYPTNTFYRFSTGAGGSIIDFIKEFENVSTKEAISILQEYYINNGINETSSYKKGETSSNIKNLELPERNTNDKGLISYLMKDRKIDYSIIKDYLLKGIAYQDKQKNMVFVGKYNDKKLFATLRSTYSDYKSVVAGSVDEIGVYVEGKNKETLVLTEGIIDQMSYRELYDTEAENNYLSINGVKKSINCLNFHLLKRDMQKNIKKVVIGFDRDDAGLKESSNLKQWINENYPNITVEIQLPMLKDFNEDLILHKDRDNEKSWNTANFSESVFKTYKVIDDDLSTVVDTELGIEMSM